MLICQIINNNQIGTNKNTQKIKQTNVYARTWPTILVGRGRGADKVHTRGIEVGVVLRDFYRETLRPTYTQLFYYASIIYTHFIKATRNILVMFLFVLTNGI